MFSEPSLSDYERSSLLSQISFEQQKLVQSNQISEQEAWSLANKGYRFEPYTVIGTLEEDDLVEIALFPVKIGMILQEYKELRLLTRDQLLRKASGINVFYPDISKADIFFYLTRGYLPHDIDISTKLKRYHQFEKFLETTQDLFLLLFQDVIDYASSLGTKYPNIERVLILYDELLGFDTTTPLISQMFGMEVVGGLTPSDTLLFAKLYAYIKAFASQTSSSSSSLNSSSLSNITLEQSVGFTESDWKRTNIYKTTKHPYETRTDYVMQIFYDYEDIRI